MLTYHILLMLCPGIFQRLAGEAPVSHTEEGFLKRNIRIPWIFMRKTKSMNWRLRTTAKRSSERFITSFISQYLYLSNTNHWGKESVTPLYIAVSRTWSVVLWWWVPLTCVCLCVCVCVRACVLARVCVHTCMYVCVPTYECVSLCVSFSEQAAKQLQKNRKHMQQKFSVNEDRRAEAKEELSQMATLHPNAKVNLEELEQKTFMVEQRMRVCVRGAMHLARHPCTLTCSKSILDIEVAYPYGHI